jgi:hypothetical protein
MRRITFCFATLALFAPAVLAAQSNTQITGQTAASAAAHGFADAEAGARAQLAIDHAASVGVPRELLESKIAEGRAKGVAEARIAAAVEHRAAILSRVKTAMESRTEARASASGDVRGQAQSRTRGEARGEGREGRDALQVEALTTAELIAAADAHELGVSLESLARLNARAGKDRALALTVLADLVASGRAPEQALLSVQAAMNRGGSALVQLGATVGGARGTVPAVRAGGGAGVGVQTGAGTRGSATAGGVIRVGGGN